MSDENRAAPPYETDELANWRSQTLTSTEWFKRNGIEFRRHYTGSLACVPSRPTLFTGLYPDTHGVTQTDGLGKMFDDSRMRWLPPKTVPTLGNWLRQAGYDTHYVGKWHISHADLVNDAGETLATNDDLGTEIPDAVAAYERADRLDEFGFSGWVGPEPHGALFANCGLARDPLYERRAVRWLQARYDARRQGIAGSERPFLLVVSFVNPHDIVLFPAWIQNMPVAPSPNDPPSVPEPPTRHEDLSTKPAAQAAYRRSYLSAYGPAEAIASIYEGAEQQYRDLYYRLHAEVDPHIGAVLDTVLENGDPGTLLVRTADHGELLGAHGGLHQKWFTLYDEATRVPFYLAELGRTLGTIVEAPTSHVDLVPTLLAAAGAKEASTAAALAESFSEVHPFPGRNLLDVLNGATLEASRPVYLMTRDNMMEGDSGASGVARRLGMGSNPPPELRIEVAADVATNFEAVVARVPADVHGGEGHLWKLARTFDDPAVWTEPNVRQLASEAAGVATFRDRVLPDEWELYDLDADPCETRNLTSAARAAAVFSHMESVLAAERARCVPPRHRPWPYVSAVGAATRDSVNAAALASNEEGDQ